jgi:TetR/AcrR family transcriptional regulator, regulator of cefoperazone and chloramphenicol sensitivity
MPEETTDIHIRSKQSGRDDSTRNKLIEAGLDVFGSMGYEAATTRIIAKQAGVNLAAIPYHFGGKEGLYNAVMQYISDTIGARLLDNLKEDEQLLAQQEASRESLFKELEKALRALGRLMIDSEIDSRFSSIIMREQLQPTSAFDRLFQGGMRLWNQLICRLVARLMERSEDDPEVIIRTHTILGQVLVFHATREAVLRQMNLKSYSKENRELILNVVIENCSRIFNCEQS